MASDTDSNVRFDNLTVRNCSLYAASDDKYTMNLRSQGTYTELSGLISLDDFVTMHPFAENTMYVLRDDFNIASRIPVQAGFVVPLTAPVKLAGVAAGSTFDLSTAVCCFVPDAAHKVWYDEARNAIMYGDINYSQGSSSTGEGVQIEYFANVDLVDESGSSGVYQLETIDNSESGVKGKDWTTLGMKSNKDANGVGGYLPINKHAPNNPAGRASMWPIKPVFLKSNEDGTFSVATHVKLTELYRPTYVLAGDGFNLNLGDKTVNRFLSTSDGFTTAQIWVKNDRSEFESMSDVNAYTTASNFDYVLDYSDSMYLTSDETVYAADPDNAILVSNTSLVRFVANSDVSTDEFHAVFYDYNITDGVIGSNVSGSDSIGPSVNTKHKGINSIDNYPGNGTSHFAFGNGNHGTGNENESFIADGIGNWVNKVNNYGSSGWPGTRPFMGLTFGLVNGLDGDGNIVWNEQIQAPLLYNEPGSGNMAGRSVYANTNLVFEQRGNVFTLQGVSGPDGGPSMSRDLTTFIHPGTHDDMYTNNFWPMDSVDAYPGKDPLEGGDVRYQFEIRDNKYGSYPPSDDGVAHNAFFGMHFEVEFDLYDDYVGPMLYYFFGDDDLWLFLDGKLILDIGGVHLSAGQYVDLRDYLPVKDADDVTAGYTTHKLTVYYNERGASGSTCWMRFRLPTPLRVTTDVPEDVTVYGDLKVEKQVEGYDSQTDDVDVAFPVEFTFKEGSGFFAPTLTDVFKYYDVDGNELGDVRSGDVLSLKAGEPVYVKQLPVGTVVSVAEDLSGFEHPEFWNLIESESTVKTEIVFGDENNLILKNRYNDKAELRITKTVVDGDNNPMDCADGFMFVGDFRVGGMPLSEPLVGYVCPVGSDPDTSGVGSTIQIYSGTSFTVPANSTVYIRNAPANLQYSIQELPAEAGRLGYALVGSPENADGTVPVGEVREAVFVNALISDMPKLPSAGGYGVFRYMVSGMSLLGIVAIELAIRKGKRTRSV